MSKNLISVIIPTRNRQKYAAFAVKQIFSLNQDIQIVLQDNSDDNSLEELISPFIKDERLIYRHITERIAAIDNYDSAAMLANGEYFIALGDDDALLPNISEMALWMKKNDVDAVKPLKDIAYVWPDPENPNKEYRTGFVWADNLSDKLELENPYDGVVEMLKEGEVRYMTYPIVRCYHGLVRTECLKEVYKRTGKYFGGISPDMYSAICLSLLPDIKFVEIGFPISLPGACPKSTTVANDKGFHAGEFKSAPHFIGLKEPYNWDKRIPEFYSVETIWGETLFKAIDAMKKDEMISEYFNRQAYINSIYHYNFELKDVLLDVLSSEDKTFIDYSYNNQMKKKNNKIIKGIKTLQKCASGTKTRAVGCEDITIAVDKINSYLSTNRNKKLWDSIMNRTI